MRPRGAVSDSVAFVGGLIGLLSLALNWFTVKPNRLAAGTSVPLWEVAGLAGALVLGALWLVCLALAVAPITRARSIGLGVGANGILLLAVVYAGLAATKLTDVAPEFARVSLSTGAWVGLAATYVLVFAARQRLQSSRGLQEALTWGGAAGALALFLSGFMDNLSIMEEFAVQGERFRQELSRHVAMFAGSVSVGVMLGAPLGVWATQSRRAARVIFAASNTSQTIPSLALFGLLIAPLSALSSAFPALRAFGIRGVGVTPAVIALTLYSLLPIVRNTYVGLRQVNPDAIDAGRGMGMSRRQIFRRIELPLAAPLALEGVRIASVQAVGNAAVAALIGAGGLGHFIFQGLGQGAPDLILLGALPVVALALAVDGAMRVCIKLATPKGVRARS